MRKGYLADLALLIAGVLVMALLLILGALSESWVALLCFVGAAVVYHTWFRHLVRFAARTADLEVEFDTYDNDDDQDIFPSA